MFPNILKMTGYPSPGGELMQLVKVVKVNISLTNAESLISNIGHETYLLKHIP